MTEREHKTMKIINCHEESPDPEASDRLSKHPLNTFGMKNLLIRRRMIDQASTQSHQILHFIMLHSATLTGMKNLLIRRLHPQPSF